MEKLVNTYSCGMGTISSSHFPGDTWSTGSYDPGMRSFPTFWAMSPDGHVFVFECHDENSRDSARDRARDCAAGI
jgi:hypothetical protein